MRKITTFHTGLYGSTGHAFIYKAARHLHIEPGDIAVQITPTNEAVVLTDKTDDVKSMFLSALDDLVAREELPDVLIGTTTVSCIRAYLHGEDLSEFPDWAVEGVVGAAADPVEVELNLLMEAKRDEFWAAYQAKTKKITEDYYLTLKSYSEFNPSKCIAFRKAERDAALKEYFDSVERAHKEIYSA